MPINKIISEGDARILVWELTESFEELKLRLSGIHKKKLKKFSSEKRKLEYLCVRVAMKELLGKETLIEYDNDGKPYLADKSAQISISHSKSWIAVMVHPSKSVGLDIECPTDKIGKIYTRFLNEAEQKELSNGHNISQLQLAWSAKETLYKIIGKDAVDFSTQLQIFSFEVKTMGEITAQHIPAKKLYQLHYIQQLAYNLVYCVD
ncbi:MAG: 4'-phosphopantetheinyl transferase superfamily protein [Paludibacter sp.]|nr:4'-phosphopantetheinyl transferase superfamily protein [Paludibacter sp.]